MPSVRLSLVLAIGSLICLSSVELAEAQIVRRFAGGGVQVNAPFVRVNVGPGGGTSVRAPFVAVDRPGGVFVGRRRRLLAQPQYAAPTQRAPQRTAPAQQAPEEADVDDLPYPTVEQLAAMDDVALIETLREMMARLHYRLSRLNTGDGWQKYLVLSREILGSPGAPPEAASFDAIADILPRYQSVQDNPQFTKISALPSFVATFAALQQANSRSARFNQSQQPSSEQSSGPAIGDPNEDSTPDNQQSPADESLEVLPTPQPTAVAPNSTRGERSILKRK